MQSLHRVCQRLVGARRTLLNELRAILFERGHAIAQGRRRLELAVDSTLADPTFILQVATGEAGMAQFSAPTS